MTDPYKYSDEDLLFLLKNGYAFQRFAFRALWPLCIDEVEAARPLFPVRYETGDIGWVYELDVGLLHTPLGTHNHRFVIFRPRLGSKVRKEPTFFLYPDADLEKVGPVEYIALVLAAQEG